MPQRFWVYPPPFAWLNSPLLGALLALIILEYESNRTEEAGRITDTLSPCQVIQVFIPLLIVVRKEFIAALDILQI